MITITAIQTFEKYSVDRSERAEVDKFLKDVIKEFGKEKVKPMLTAFQGWVAKNINNINHVPVKALSSDVTRRRNKKTVRVFNDKYSKVMIAFLHSHGAAYEKELVEVLKNLKDLNTIVDGNLVMGPLLNRRDSQLAEDIFKVVRKDSGVVTVLKPIRKNKVSRHTKDSKDSKASKESGSTHPSKPQKKNETVSQDKKKVLAKANNDVSKQHDLLSSKLSNLKI
ncbi:unnamed protein product [Ambrosiozyma monospora]|uniref:Unnamed protein product n=1 Tax=Ambrosiozyma monospora TaxID=43982 RepID=A0ACB5T5R7_AMBMO|nr:unnamed protein product [Ambrosiozyma monospora]